MLGNLKNSTGTKVSDVQFYYENVVKKGKKPFSRPSIKINPRPFSRPAINIKVKSLIFLSNLNEHFINITITTNPKNTSTKNCFFFHVLDIEIFRPSDFENLLFTKVFSASIIRF